MDRIVVLDFGSQTAQLIARRIREAGVYAEIIPGETRVSEIARDGLVGLVFSGSPESVGRAGSPEPDRAVYDLGVPILGICYGLQWMTHDLGGSVRVSETHEYGRSRVVFREKHPLFDGVDDGFVSWMSHGDGVQKLAAGCSVVAESEHGVPACVAFPAINSVGIQFHPEVTHCEFGQKILENFAHKVCRAAADWTIDAVAEKSIDSIRTTVGTEDVLLLISGGVDSTVVAALLLKALPSERVHLMYVNTGLMRKNESEEVAGALKKLGAENLHLIDAEQRFLTALAGVDSPEEKRRIIGDMFISVQADSIRRTLPGEYFLAQGTLYTDMIESGRGVGKNAHVIKSHHNVRSPLVEEKRAAGRIVEPLAELYKDEVRKLGVALGVDETVVKRHPFPGPGLAVRILGEVTKEKCDILRDVDEIYISELKKRGLYDEIWQAFSVLLPIRSVGVAGDARDYGYVVALRAVISTDGMTADVYPFPTNHLLEISSIITNRVRLVGRVVYDVSSKPPSTIEWE